MAGERRGSIGLDSDPAAAGALQVGRAVPGGLAPGPDHDHGTVLQMEVASHYQAVATIVATAAEDEGGPGARPGDGPEVLSGQSAGLLHELQ